MALIQFTRNYRDLSTDTGFQFEFFCDRCGNGYQTEFQASTLGTVTSALDAASNLFGGVFGSAANAARNVRSAGWEKAHDNAFATAVEEAKPHFHKCKRCGHWVDDDCWNTARTLCKDCAPDLQEEFSSIQVDAAINDARMKASQVSYVLAGSFCRYLIDRYGITDEQTLRFFRVHERADVEHSAVCRALLDRLPEAERDEAIAAGEELAGALWNFLSGVEARASVH